MLDQELTTKGRRLVQIEKDIARRARQQKEGPAPVPAEPRPSAVAPAETSTDPEMDGRLEEARKRLRETIERTARLNREAGEKLADIEARTEEVSRRYEEISAVLEECDGAVLARECANADLAGRREVLEIEYAFLTGPAADNLRSELADLTAQRDDTADELAGIREEYRAAVEENEAKIGELAGRREALAVEIEEKQGSIELLQERLRDDRIKHDELARVSAGLGDEKQARQEELDRVRGELDQVRGQLEEQEKREKQLQGRIEARTEAFAMEQERMS